LENYIQLIYLTKLPDTNDISSLDIQHQKEAAIKAEAK